MKGLGLLLLLIGIGLIAYAFMASDSLNTAVNAAINSTLSWLMASLPPGNTLWLLVGGSGAAILGITLIFRRPAGSRKAGT